MDFGDRAGSRPHAHGNPCSLECRPGGRRGTQDALAIADDDLTIRAQIDQPNRCIGFVQTRGQYARQNVAAHETAQPRKEVDPWSPYRWRLTRPWLPSQLVHGE